MTTTARAGVALAAVCLCLDASAPAQAKSRKHRHHHQRSPHGHHADKGVASEGRNHLKRANALAGEGDCAAAIEEYTKAYELLDDPVVLFNRGECYRRTGDSEKAVDDYRAFLDKAPNAPNRGDIEARIVELEAPEPAPREPSAEPQRPAPPSKPAEARTRQPPPSPAPLPKPETRPEPEAAVAVRRAVPAEDSGPAGGSRPWVWVALSVLVVGAGVAGYLLLRPHQQPPPDSALGNYRF